MKTRGNKMSCLRSHNEKHPHKSVQFRQPYTPHFGFCCAGTSEASDFSQTVVILYHASVKHGFSILTPQAHFPYLAPVLGLLLPGLGLWSPCPLANSSKSLPHWSPCPFPPIQGLSPAPLGEQLRFSVARSPLPGPLHSFSSPNISATFTCTCHTNFLVFPLQHSFYFQEVKGAFQSP